MFDAADCDIQMGVGAQMILTLKKLAHQPNTAMHYQEDWQLIENWLGCANRELTEEDIGRIDLAWQAYIFAGVVPAQELRPVIDGLTESLNITSKLMVQRMPPAEVMNVFFRLLEDSQACKSSESLSRLLTSPVSNVITRQEG